MYPYSAACAWRTSSVRLCSRSPAPAAWLKCAKNSMFPSGPLTGEYVSARTVKPSSPGQRQKVLQHLQMDRRVPDDTLFANLFPPRLKLGLDQTQHLARPA